MKAIRPWLKFTLVGLVLVWYLGRLLIISSLKGKSIERGFRFRRKFCRTALSILNIQYHHSGFEHNGACLYVSNHRSMLDPLIQLAYIDAFIVSKAEVGNYPVLGRGAKETGIILVHRHDHNSRKAALDVIEATLKSGYPVLVYPEGTTYGGEFTGDFRKGAIDLAFSKGIPVVPVVIEYPDAGYYWTDDSLLGYFKRLFSAFGTHHVVGEIGKEMKNGSPDHLVEDTRAAINMMMINARSKFKNN
jgi:1-acyl-sn-glycerol-3-phosphate acyltransferase